MPTVATRAGSLAYDAIGDGPPVVLLASGAHDRHDWDGVRPALAERYRTIAIDWPGHGESPVPPSPWGASAPGFADAVEDAVTSLALGPAAFIGNSVGGYASARLAITRPGAVRALVLVDSGGFVPQHLGTKLFCAMMGRPGFVRRFYPRFSSWYMRASTDEDRRIQAGAAAMATSIQGSRVTAGLWRSFATPEHDLRSRAAAIRAPTLVVWGARDPVIPLKVGRRIADAILGARLVTLDAGHVPYSTHPQGFLAAVLPFLADAMVPLP
jgi:pimeloyl-ACP methyl ester carboxylesterase